ncbi:MULTISPECIES: aromatic acid exporter family protein [Terrisporobacter]|uniref:Membrane protein n=2 Tax=Terrisporobacter TaxID=1505652 RepID=A0A0B3VPN2_9FIRM|nr:MULTISPECIES: aromatic acid exporter family protein [Terrisporobacter]KHS58721.1 membrane protein [Terrisporobacter othiniensis]MCC3671371.1 aromatic acid exporter family protein [Terrisporobacter mayombei]MDU6984170.1 aromatic acid exporter family protein [Terrisporobacter othiniensis]MDY3375259.1 aromatic acid exporter family protein [Terrisporobacter othiniensis]
MNKTDAVKVLKLSLGSILAIIIASFFKLQYSTVAGVITLLVVKDTKKETLKGAFGKLFGFVLCTVYSYICFNLLGYNLFAFSLYILIIIGTCFVLNIRYVIAMCVVISSHYLLQSSMSIYWILNETGLFIIGAGIGIIINMYMPSNFHKIYLGQQKLQEQVSLILMDIADIISNPDKNLSFQDNLDELNKLIKNSTKDAYENINNNLLSDTKYFLEHMEIIKSQRDILNNLYTLVSQLNYVPSQGYIVSEFINKVGNTSFEANTVTNLLSDLNRISNDMKTQPLPKDREEFENRAILFLCLTELKKYLVNRKNAQFLRDNYYNN